MVRRVDGGIQSLSGISSAKGSTNDLLFQLKEVRTHIPSLTFPLGGRELAIAPAKDAWPVGN